MRAGAPVGTDVEVEACSPEFLYEVIGGEVKKVLKI